VLDLALGIQVTVEGTPCGPPVQQLHAADLDDTVIELGLETCGLGVQDDLSHGGRVYRKDRSCKASIASFASRSTRSLPGTPACARLRAVSSMRLLVVSASAPWSSVSRSPVCSSAAQPPGPGLPRQAPSV